MEDKCFQVVVHHFPCADGDCAAWIVKKHNPDIELVPCKAGSEPMVPLDHFADKRVIYVDICPMPDYLLRLATLARSVLIIDHHKTNYERIQAMGQVPDNVKFIFDMNYSGCQLTWRYFSNADEPWFVQCIGDRDTWKFMLPFTREYFSGMSEQGLLCQAGFQTMYDNSRNSSFIDNVLQKGIKEIEFRDRCISDIVEYRKLECTYAEEGQQYRVWLYTCDNKTLSSDVGNRLMAVPFNDGVMPDFSIGWSYDVVENFFNLSMRSIDQCKDVSAICAKYGGGGHRNAAGCRVPPPLCNYFIPVPVPVPVPPPSVSK